MSVQNLEVLYEDRDIIVVVKPPGVPSQRDRSGDQDMYSLVCSYTRKDSIGLLQRLDRPVGGIMVMTKSAEASKAMTRNLQERKIDKYYLAVVDGEAQNNDHIESFIRKVRGNRAIVSQKNVSGAQKGLLTYRCLDRKMISKKGLDSEKYVIRTNALSLLEVKLYTGRFHQIRAQLAHARLPIVGDTKYNKAYTDAKGWYRIGLYAYRLEFNHPVTSEPMSFRHVNEEVPFDLFHESLDKLCRDE